MKNIFSNNKLSQYSIWILGYVLLVGLSITYRPLLPVDETRYLSVAWEMWLRSDFLVPYLNGEPYSHKPPLLFWSINAGWAVFGVNELWPRLVAPIFGFGCLWITYAIANYFYPNTKSGFYSILILLGCFYWGTYTTLTMFDLIVTFWTLLGIFGLIAVTRGSIWKGWSLVGLSIGLGILSKGPVIFLFILPCIILAPFWVNRKINYTWSKWYLSSFIAILIGIIIGLLWAVPAGIYGGAEYQKAIFWGQSAGRVVNSFAHERPFWWYLGIAPLISLPWLIWPTMLKVLWLRLTRQVAEKPKHQASRLFLIWVSIPFVILSIISGKQPHYLLPLFPALAIFAAGLLINLPNNIITNARVDITPISLISVIIGLAIIVVANFGDSDEFIITTNQLNTFWSIPPILFGLVTFLKPPLTIETKLIASSILSLTIIISIHGCLSPYLAQHYDMKKLASHISNAQKAGYNIANKDKYHGQYNFLGRLLAPIQFTDSKLLGGWLNKNPKSKVVSYHYISPISNKPEFLSRFRQRYIAVWDGKKLAKNPEFTFRADETD